MADVPEAQDAGGCSLVVDLLDPATVLAAVYLHTTNGVPPPGWNGIQYFVSFDGAAHWRPLVNAPNSQLLNFATYEGHIYGTHAVGTGSGAGSGGSVTYTFSVSDDQMETWRPLDASLPAAARGQMQQFAVDPATGGILIEVNLSTLGLWTSTDGGASWQTVPPPGTANGASTETLNVVQPGPQGWQLCIAVTSAAQSLYGCTLDGGKTWTLHSAAIVCTPACPQNGWPIGLVGLTPGGSLLSTGLAQSSSTPGTLVPALFLLPVGASTWQDLGPIPLGPTLYRPSPGILWSLKDGPHPGTSQTVATATLR
jgi:hypothetical protein